MRPVLHWLRDTWDPPFTFEDPAEAVAARVLNHTLLGAVTYLLIPFVAVLSFLIVRTFAAGMMGLAILGATLWSLRELRRGRIRRAAWLFLSTLWMVATGLMVFGGGIRSQALLPMLVTVLTATWVLGRRAGLVWTAVFLVTTFALVVAETLGIAPPQYFPFPPMAGWFLLIFWVALVVIPIGDILGTLNDSLAAVRAKVAGMTRTEEALRKSEERFRTMAEHLVSVLVTTDAAGNITYLSPSASRMFGWIPAQTPGRPFTDLLADSALSKGSSALQTTLSGSEPVRELELEMKRSDGSEFTAELSLSASTQGGSVTGAIGLIRDTTARKLAERSLRESEARYRDLFEEIPVGIYRSTAAGRIVMANPALCDMLGCGSFEELCRADIGRDLYVQPEKRRELLDVLAQEGSLRNVEFCLRRKDGRIITVLENCRLVRDGSGEETYYEGILVDVSERKRAEESLRREQRFTERIIDAVPGIFFAFDQHRHYVRWNRAHAVLFGMPSEQIREIDALDRIHEDDRPLVAATIEKIYATGAGEVEARGLVGAGPETRHFLMTGRLIELDGSPYVVGCGIDITERKEAEIIRARLEAQLLEARKLESIGRLSGGIAHDFNNLLTVINGYAEIVLARMGDHPVREPGTQILKAGQRAAELTNQLLAFSRRQIVHPRPLDLNAIIEDTANMIRRIIGEDITLSTRLQPGLHSVVADPGQVSQILINLATNARDAIPEGGRLIVETGNASLGRGYVALHSSVTPGDYVRITVTDSGAGMDEVTAARIFEPFFTTKPEGSGTGLGLATVHGIVKQAGGHIWVYTEPGHGASFKIYLPAVNTPAVSEPDRGAVENGPRGSGTILLAEDQPDVRQLISEILRDAGYQVLSAHNGNEALNLAREHAGTIHLLITDLVMPGLNGRQLAGQLSPLHPAMKVLLISGYTEDTILRTGGLDPGVHFLSKPFAPQNLAAKVAAILHPR